VSYARFGADGSDVYVFMAVEGWLECCSCWLQPLVPAGLHESFHASSTDEMVTHLRAHTAAGHHVPADVVPDLRADDEENFPRLTDVGEREQP
jgi:hypothetical protein